MRALLSLIFASATAGISLVVAVYPLLIWLLGRRSEQPAFSESSFSITFIIAARNAERLIAEKIRNCQEIDYPAERIEIIVSSDGSTDGTAAVARKAEWRNVRVCENEKHRGKWAALNDAVQLASGEILVFTDADAMLSRDALRALLNPLADPEVGGVCGRRSISQEATALRAAQDTYINLDTQLKIWESSLGRLTSNDGKLYAIRAELFSPVPPGVTDDLYTALTVLLRDRKFVFASGAQATITAPSRSASHEIDRRRRIVGQSFGSIFHRAELFSSGRLGLYPAQLLINKVGRRLMPLGLVGLFVSSLGLATRSVFFRLVLLCQSGFYLLALASPLLPQRPKARLVKRIADKCCYFCLGQYGTLLGLYDYLRGRRQSHWEPRKDDR